MPTTFTTSVYNAQKESRENPSRLAAPNVASGEVEFAVIPYTLTSGTDEAANDIINLCVLPAGAIPLPQFSSLACIADPGTAFTVDVGTTGAADCWGIGVALTVPGVVPFCTSTVAPAWVVPTPLVADNGSGNVVVFATVKTSTAPAAGETLYFTLAYKNGR